MATKSSKKSDKMEISDSDEDIDIDIQRDDKKQQDSSNKNKKTNNKNSKKKSNKKNYKGNYSDKNKMWIEKYRPSGLNEIISHTSIITTISALVSKRKLPHLLFYGPPGTGKTTTILACARELNGSSWKSMTLELNASDERGIGIIRDRIKIFASTKQIFHQGFKLIILDEADAMTSSAQFALRRIIEKYTKNARFCLICNYVNKIIPALQSRCTKFRFAPLADDDIKNRLKYIASKENINLKEDGIKSILRLSNGDMRKCLNIMQSSHTSYNIVNEDSVYECTGKPKQSEIQNILNHLLNKDFKESYTRINNIMITNGLALSDIIDGIYKLMIRLKIDNIVLCKVLAELADLQYRLTVATNTKVQLGSLVAIFQVVRHTAFKEHKKKQMSPSQGNQSNQMNVE
eukprot:327095_1